MLSIADSAQRQPSPEPSTTLAPAHARVGLASPPHLLAGPITILGDPASKPGRRLGGRPGLGPRGPPPRRRRGDRERARSASVAELTRDQDDVESPSDQERGEAVPEAVERQPLVAGEPCVIDGVEEHGQHCCRRVPAPRGPRRRSRPARGTCSCSSERLTARRRRRHDDVSPRGG